MAGILPLQQINYLAQMPQVDLGQRLAQGLQLGAAIREANEKAQAEEEARKAREQYAMDLSAAMRNPTAQAFAMLTAKYPGQREAFKQSWDTLSTDQQNAEFSAGTQAWHALNTGNTQVALDLLDQRIAAGKNSGRDVGNLEVMRAAIERDPKTSAAHIGLVLSAVNPERWAKVATEQRAMEKAPAELTKAQADAHKAAVEAKFAESVAVKDLEKRGVDIQAVQENIKIAKINSQIAAAQAATAREGNALKRQEMQIKLQELQQKRDSEVRGHVAEVESARMNMDNMLNTADRVLNTPRYVVESAAGPISSKIPTLSSETADFEELVNTLASQAFMAQVPNLKGIGALSDAEGKKLQAALQNLSLRQSPARLLDNVREAQRLILKARTNVAARYGLPDTIPNTPAAADAPAGDIDALIKKYAP